MIVIATPPTTSQRFTPQKYRGHTLEILGVLSELGGLTTNEIADKTGLKKEIVKVYCHRGYKRGIIDKREAWGWSISSRGLTIISTTTTTTTASNTKVTQKEHKSNTKVTQKPRQLDISDFTGREDMDEIDKTVVGVLIDHYQRTGLKFLHFADVYEVGRGLGIASQDVTPTLRHLRNEGIIYFRREALGWKLGLMKAFVWRLENI